MGAGVISSERIERLQVALAAGEVAELAFREPERLRARLVRILGTAAGNHAANVRRLAVRLAQRLEIPESSVGAIALGSVLHDVGKFAFQLDSFAQASNAQFQLFRDADVFDQARRAIHDRLESLRPTAAAA